MARERQRTEVGGWRVHVTRNGFFWRRRNLIRLGRLLQLPPGDWRLPGARIYNVLASRMAVTLDHAKRKCRFCNGLCSGLRIRAIWPDGAVLYTCSSRLVQYKDGWRIVPKPGG